MMHHVYTGKAVVTTQKIDIFLLVTTRLIAHSGQSGCFRNCVGELGMDTRYPMVTSKEISNCLGDHPRRNTLINQSIYKVYILVIGGNFGRHQNACFCYQKVATRSRSVSVHSDLNYDASRVHRKGRGDNSKN